MLGIAAISLFALINLGSAVVAQEESTPPAPTGLTASVESDGIDLSWTAPVVDEGGANPTGYDVEMGEPTGEGEISFSTIAEDVTGTEYTSTELLYTGRTYEFRVSAVYSETSSSNPSGTATVTAPSVPKPQSLSTSRSSSGISVSWTAPLSWDDLSVSLSGYVIERVSWYRVSHETLGQDYRDEVLTSVDSSTTSYTDTTTIRPKSYGYSVYSVFGGYVRSNDQTGDETYLVGVNTASE